MDLCKLMLVTGYLWCTYLLLILLMSVNFDLRIGEGSGVMVLEVS